MITWKENWEESKKRYLDWWNGKGIVLSMWEHLKKRWCFLCRCAKAASAKGFEAVLV